MEDVVVFAALSWEARAVLDGLQGVEAPEPRRWRGYLGDGASVTVLQVGIGPERARLAAERAPAADLFVSMGCAGALAGGLHAGDIVIGESVVVLDSAGRQVGQLAVEPRAILAWAAARGIAVRSGPVASSPIVLGSRDLRTMAGRGGALAVEMESAGVVAVAQARGTRSALVKVILDEAGDDVALPGGNLVDAATGDLDVPRALAAIAPRPHYWPAALRLARQQRVAERRLREFLAVLFSAGLEAFGLVPPAAGRTASAQTG